MRIRSTTRRSAARHACLMLMLMLAACTTAPSNLTPSGDPPNDMLVGVMAQATAAPDSPTLTQRSATDLLPAIVFESNRSGRYEIYAMNSQGRDLHQLTTGDNVDGSGSPDWSPDGLGVVFSSRRGNDWDLWLLSGGVEANLTHTVSEDDKGDWSPDGTRIAFSSVREGLRWADIFVMDADGSHVINLTSDLDDDREPVWSPSGDEVIYRSFRDGNYDLYALDFASRAPRQLTKTDPPIWNASPVWSPDGKWIAFESNRGDGGYDLYLMDNNGQRLRNLTNHPADDKEPAWSPDGTKLVFSSDRDGNFELYTLEVASGAVTRLTYDCGRDHNPDWRRGEEPIDSDEPPTAIAYAQRDLNLRAGPGEVFVTVSGAAVDDCLTVIGRSSDGQWLQVRLTQGRSAWVARSLVALQGDYDHLPATS